MTTALKVLMVASSYPADAQDWRSRFIRDLVAALASLPDIDLRLVAPGGDLPQGVANVTEPRERRWLDGLMQRGGIAHALRSRGPLAAADVLRLLAILRSNYRRQHDVDLIHVNWLQNAIPLPSGGTPLVLNVLGSDLAMLRLPLVTTALRRVISRRPCVIAPNAGWMRAELEHRFGDKAPIRPVAFGVDPTWFDVIRRPATTGRRAWLVVARVTRKKIGPLFEWGAGMFDRDDELHLFGPRQEDVPIPPWVTYHGPTYPADLRENWFPRAAGLITLSQHDEGRPQVLQEAMAAGLPVIASDTPAHRDLILPGETGWLCDSPDAFQAALTALSADSHNRAVGAAASDWMRENIGTWKDCAMRYHELYEELAGRNR